MYPGGPLGRPYGHSVRCVWTVVRVCYRAVVVGGVRTLYVCTGWCVVVAYVVRLWRTGHRVCTAWGSNRVGLVRGRRCQGGFIAVPVGVALWQ